MKIKYTFVNGEVSEVEVDGDVAEIIETMNKKDHADSERVRVHTLSLNAMLFDGKEISDQCDPSAEVMNEMQNQALHQAMSTLTPPQRRRLKLYAEGKSTYEIARLEGVSQMMVRKTIGKARVNMQKKLKKSNFF